MSNPAKVKEYILCAAIHYKDNIKREHQPKNIETGVVVCGRRHSNCFITLFMISDEKNFNNENSTQGFLTSEDRFVDRKIGMHIALRVGQIKKKQNTLISEDLY